MVDEIQRPDPLGPAPLGFGAIPDTLPPAGHVFTTSSTAETKPVEDPPDTKEQHFEAIRYLIAELTKISNENTKLTLGKITIRLDAIEGY